VRDDRCDDKIVSIEQLPSLSELILSLVFRSWSLGYVRPVTSISRASETDLLGEDRSSDSTLDLIIVRLNTSACSHNSSPH